MRKKYAELLDFLGNYPQWTDCGWVQTYLPYHHNLKGKRILDVGCGNSLFAYALVQAGVSSYTGIDSNAEVFNPQNDDWAKTIHSYRKTLIKKYPNLISYQMMSADDMQFQDETFDLAIAVTVTEHLPNPEETFKEIYRVLVPGGYFFFSHHNFYGWDGHHQGPYNVNELEGELTDTQKTVLDWRHLEADIEYENTYLNKIRWYKLRELVSKQFFIITWDTKYSYEQRGIARLTNEILNKYSSKYTYEDLAVLENICLSKKLTPEEQQIMGDSRPSRF
ncbi:MAG: class I SAM-dependent methyltransferase [Desulfotomaculaceae bacterium]|nr:class I SAM-dependent methyltransferase [Desulfotomaculaceae bacterium]MDD4766378.1 class I SAM-dependent methyltransferase [Desulfotomaculaceae bacterium]